MTNAQNFFLLKTIKQMNNINAYLQTFNTYFCYNVSILFEYA